MAENLLTVENISKTYGEKKLFENISFGINKGDKIALIARNGEGKTTLLRILTNKETADNGTISLRQNLSIAYLEQSSSFQSEHSIAEHLFQGENLLAKTFRRYESSLYEMQAHPNEENKKNLQHSMEEMDRLNGWNFENQVKEILFKLGITQIHQPMSQLSGGEQRKVALAKILLDTSADIFLLDEPTNHLDIKMIAWLEDYLSKQSKTLFIVTHDRYFLDKTCNQIIEIDHTNLYKYNGNYAYFIEKKAQRQEQEMAEIEKARNLYRKELEWIRRMPKARGTKAKARIDAFDKIKEKASQKIQEQASELTVKTERMGTKVIEVFHLNKNHGERRMVEDFTYIFTKGEKIGVIGGNGVGKTTWLNLIAGMLKPDSGKIAVGQSVRFGYYTQNGLQEKDNMRVLDIIKEVAEVVQMERGTVSASQFLRHFGFSDSTQYNYYGNLSGGEKRRLYLLKTLMENPNFLILDEPTNDLDIFTLMVLENFLLQYKGCLIIVSHDRSFLDNLTDHLFVFEGDGAIKDFPGNYSDYLIAKQQESATPNIRISTKPAKEKRAFERKNKRSYREECEWKLLSEEIGKLNDENQTLIQKLSGGEENHEELTACGKRMEEIKILLDQKEWRWLELSEKDG